MFKKITMIMTAVVLAGLMATPSSASHRSKSSSAYTTAGLSMRTCASTSCHRIRIIPAGSRVRVRHCRGGWCRVSFRGHTGFASKRYIRRGGARYHRRHIPRRHYRNGIQLRFHIGL